MVVSTSGLFALHNLVTNQKYIYFGVSAFFLAVGVFNCFAIKDIVLEQKAQAKVIEQQLELETH